MTAAAFTMVTRFAAYWMGSIGLLFAAPVLAQQPPYDVFPAAKPPYHRVRYEASTQPGELIFPVRLRRIFFLAMKRPIEGIVRGYAVYNETESLFLTAVRPIFSAQLFLIFPSVQSRKELTIYKRRLHNHYTIKKNNQKFIMS